MIAPHNVDRGGRRHGGSVRNQVHAPSPSNRVAVLAVKLDCMHRDGQIGRGRPRLSYHGTENSLYLGAVEDAGGSQLLILFQSPRQSR